MGQDYVFFAQAAVTGEFLGIIRFLGVLHEPLSKHRQTVRGTIVGRVGEFLTTQPDRRFAQVAVLCAGRAAGLFKMLVFERAALPRAI